jgi:hypothetical protein
MRNELPIHSAFITIHTFVLFSPTATVITSTKSSVFPCNMEFSSGTAKSLLAVRCKVQTDCFAEIFAMLCPTCYNKKTFKTITTRALKRDTHVSRIDRIHVNGVIK